LNRPPATTLVHEAFHVWQRQHGVWVATSAALPQLLNELGLYDPYDYTPQSNAADMLTEFLDGGVEVQVAIFEDYTAVVGR
jgi:hypothetical protein